MSCIDLSKSAWVHFTGIGGISMSALAEILLSKGFKVTGSDTKSTNITKHLETLGAIIYYDQAANNINKDMNLLVYTAAVHADNDELIAAEKLSIPIVSRAVFLGQIMKNYDVAIGVSGTHGKTTTTSLLSGILLNGQMDPTILVGGILNNINGNIRIGKSGNFITEACEYTNSFLSFSPTMEIILNITEDHMDFFKDITDIRNSFKKYTKLLPKDGTLIINSDIEDIGYFIDDLECKVITFGSDPFKSNYSAANIQFDENANGHFDLLENGETLGRIHLNTIGQHNISNSLAAIAAAMDLGLSFTTIKDGLESFNGTNRRFQHKGNIHGITIIDDYAHHPDEIRVTLEAVKNLPHNRTWCVFQPHTYTRTRAFLKEFAQTLALADKVILADIYAAREKNTIGISSKDILKELKLLDCDAYYFPSFDEIENFLLENCINGDLVITMGAGDIVLVGENLLGQ